MQSKKTQRLCLSFLTLTLSACENLNVTVPNWTNCAVNGLLEGGGVCAQSETDKTTKLTFREIVDFLDAQPERICVPIDGLSVCKEDQSIGEVKTLPARGAAICKSSEDELKLKITLEVACRMLGSKCTKEIKEVIEKNEKITATLKKVL